MPKRKTTVLVADDDLQLLDLVTLNLELEGYGVLRASDGRQALERIERHHPDLVLLDVMMPRMSGFAVCHRVRACSTVPIIIITARGQEQEKIRGLDLGADDYLVKPFSVGELLARVRAVLRRAQFTTGELAPTGQSPTILGALSIDYAQRKVAMAGRKVVLTATEYRLLAYLAHNADRIVPQEHLLEHAWGSAYVGEDHLLQVNINRLRRKLEPDPAHPRYLLTEPGAGYVLATPPQAQAGPKPAEGREPMMDAERHRLGEAEAHHQPWYRWGPYLAERQWGTVREDYSPSGTAWDSFPHDHARSRAYRWGEDGLLGICDDQGFLCFALALWNEADPILKERFFGLTGTEGNHGEDGKEYYFFLDNTPTHSYMKALYKYPQRAFPYAELVAENRRRGRSEPEYELLDTGVFTGNRYFDVTVEYAKVGPEDILIRMTATNRGPGAAPLHLLPTLWYRNTWAWGYDHRRPELRAIREEGAIHQAPRLVRAAHHTLGEYWLMCERVEEMPALLFTENESNAERLWGVPGRTPFVKDGINDAVVHGARGTVNPKGVGTRVAAHYRFLVAAGATQAVLLRLSAQRHSAPFAGAAELFTQRREEADHFYQAFGPAWMSEDARSVQRQAFAGLLWSKQFYYYDVAQWLDGDPAGPPPPPERHGGRNAEWRHLNNADVLSMPDTWEFPWYAAWDLACHCIPLALVDPSFAKRQLILLLREWYMHPNGQLPAYEWGFGDVNPPVHAWAAWRVYKIEQRATGKADRAFLERVFHKLLLNFTWWVNRKDRDGRNVFQGGFLGLDNIGVFDRGAPLPTGGHLEQSDGTAWMGMYCLTMLTIALELSRENRVYEDVATKFFEHFLYIAGALNDIGSAGIALWDEEDEFFYDVLHLPDGEVRPLKIRSLVGIVPLLAVETIEPDLLETLPEFRARLEWFLANRPGLSSLVSRWQEPGMGERRLLALVRGHRMKRLLKRLLDPEEFLGDHGIRSISKYRAHHPFVYQVNGRQYTVRYEPAESESGVFGGNSNWRGPIWFPINYLLIEALQKFHHYYGDDFLVECPTGSGTMLTLWQIAEELSCRLTHIFLRDPHGRRPVFGSNEVFQTDPDFRDYLLFHEYFHGETGAGLGASHQTGWTALVAKLLEQTGGR